MEEEYEIVYDIGERKPVEFKDMTVDEKLVFCIRGPGSLLFWQLKDTIKTVIREEVKEIMNEEKH